MNNEIFRSTLAHLMKIYGNMSVSELARSTNIPQPTLHHILAGDTKNPRRKCLETLANFFSISIKQLLGEELLPNIIPETIKNDLKISSIQIIQWDMLKKWPLVNRNSAFKTILVEQPINANSFALKMEQQFMENLFPQDSLLIFDIDKIPNDRDFVIVHIANADSIYFNRLFKDNNENYLKHNLHDGNAQLLKLNKKLDRIIGVLIEVRIQY